MRELAERLARRAWEILNHDNDPCSGKPDDAHNWKILVDAMDYELANQAERERRRRRASLTVKATP